METTQDKLSSIGEMIGTETNRKLDELVANGSRAAKPIAEYVRANPWTAVGIAAGVGLVIALLIKRD